MIPYVTKVAHLEKVEADKLKELKDWCSFCAGRDSTFTYQVDWTSLLVFSGDKNQAFKRGSAIKQRFGLYYNVEWTENVK